ncbi:hypothetical protein Tco_1316424 [Tanacetum coccineum]
MTESPLVDSGFVVPVFSLGVDPITCLNKAMAFLTVVSSSREDKVKFIMVLGIRVMLLVRGETMLVDKQGLLNATTVKVKDIWLGNALSLSDQGMQHDPGVPDGQVIQTIIPNNAAFQTEDLDTYDSNCDDILNAKAVLMANISNYGPDIISEAQEDSMILSVIEQILEQMINNVNNWEKANKEQNNESLTGKPITSRPKKMVMAGNDGRGPVVVWQIERWRWTSGDGCDRGVKVTMCLVWCGEMTMIWHRLEMVAEGVEKKGARGDGRVGP